MVENSVLDLNDLCVKLDICCFNEKEVIFLKENCAVLKTLSRGLDILQGKDNCFYGTLLPTLETIIKQVDVFPYLKTRCLCVLLQHKYTF